jgi:hypothetical protein
MTAFNLFTYDDSERTVGRELKPCSATEVALRKTKTNFTNADALKTPEVLTLEFRATGGRRSLTLGRPWNDLLEDR